MPDSGYNQALFNGRINAMECTVRWTGLSGMTFLAETGSGHVVAMDGAPDGGGRNLAPRPMEMVLINVLRSLSNRAWIVP